MIGKDNIRKQLLGKLKEQRNSADESYKNLLKASAEAPGAMESHSDTSKFQFGKMAEDVFKQINNFDKIISELEKKDDVSSDRVRQGSLVLVEENEDNVYFYIVSEGVGGQKIKGGENDIQTISVGSPIGIMLLNKIRGEEIIWKTPKGDRIIKILDIM